MKDNSEKEINVEHKQKESPAIKIATDIGNVGVEVSKKVGTVITEFFIGKQPTKEEKELNEIRKERKLKLKLIQEDAQYQKDLKAAERGEYIPPPPEIKEKKKKSGGMFSNLGKNDPLKGFGSSKEPNFNIGRFGGGNSSNSPDFGLDGFIGTKNPIGTKKRRRY